jgi:hypothetical protein
MNLEAMDKHMLVEFPHHLEGRIVFLPDDVKTIDEAMVFANSKDHESADGGSIRLALTPHQFRDKNGLLDQVSQRFFILASIEQYAFMFQRL